LLALKQLPISVEMHMTLNKAHVVEEEVKRRNEKKTFSTIGLVY
jgi:hypothetical protein